jgi:hypothetical protein
MGVACVCAVMRGPAALVRNGCVTSRLSGTHTHHSQAKKLGGVMIGNDSWFFE